MEKHKIDRISELSAISRERALTPEEQQERALLRTEYVAGFRQNMEQVLANVRIREQDGTLVPLNRKEEPLP